jgi:predicted phage tail protein
MVTQEEFRSLALSLPEVEERVHMGHPDFRVAGNDHQGQQAIQSWAEQTSSQYRICQTPKAAQEEGGATLVTADVAGDFPGSPIELTVRFVTDDGKIRDLKIG